MRTTRRSDATRRRIALAAIDVIGEVGYSGVSLADIAQRAGVTKATIYYHFDSKEDVYAAALAASMERFDRAVESAIGDSSTPAEGLARAIEAMFRQMMEPTQRYQPLPDPSILPPEGLALMREHRRRYEGRITAVIEAGQAAGSVIPGNPTILARMLITSVGRVARWFQVGGKVTEAEMIALLQGVYLHGMLTEGTTPTRPLESTSTSPRHVAQFKDRDRDPTSQSLLTR